MAVYATMFMGVQPIGALIAGVIAKKIGAPRTLTIFGTLVLIGGLFFLFRGVMRLRQTQMATEPQAGLGRASQSDFAGASAAGGRVIFWRVAGPFQWCGARDR